MVEVRRVFILFSLSLSLEICLVKSPGEYCIFRFFTDFLVSYLTANYTNRYGQGRTNGHFIKLEERNDG